MIAGAKPKWTRPSRDNAEQMCRKCRTVKPISEFAANRSPLGRSFLCLECRLGGPIEVVHPRPNSINRTVVRAGGQWWSINAQGVLKLKTGYCERCGAEFPGLDWAKRPRRFCSRTCAAIATNAMKRQNHPGKGNPNWRGGRRKTGCGYIDIHMPGHPMAGAHGTVLEHRLVMEEMVGRILTKDENVHHKNGIRTDNRPENLELWSKKHPVGARVSDQVQWAREILRDYGHLYPEEQKVSE